LPEDEQTSKHGGGGRYDAILEFKGEQVKKIIKKKRRKNEKEREISEKEKKYEYV
jgi:hypothetical protein